MRDIYTTRAYRIGFVLGILGSMGISASGSFAQGQSRSEASSRSYFYDGGEVRQIQLDPEEVAEFDPREETKADVHEARKEAKEIRQIQKNTIRLWKVAPQSGEDVVRTLSVKVPRGRFSPVYRDGKGGRRRSLPGGVLVSLDPSWDEKRVEDWAKDHGYRFKEKLSFSKNLYLLDSPLGLPSLDTANELQESGEVIWASPNWWQEVEPK